MEMADINAFIENTLLSRARLIADKVVNEEIAYLLSVGDPIPQSHDDIFASAVSHGRAKSALARSAAFMPQQSPPPTSPHPTPNSMP